MFIRIIASDIMIVVIYDGGRGVDTHGYKLYRYMFI